MTTDDTFHQREEDHLPRRHRRRTDTGIRGWIWRNLGVVSYLILVAAIAFSMNSIQNESEDRRADIVHATQEVIHDSCERGNDTRRLLRGLIREGQTVNKKYLEEGLLTRAQYDRAIATNNEAIKKLHDIDCASAVKQVREVDTDS
jgi:hypothetical protein